MSSFPCFFVIGCFCVLNLIDRIIRQRSCQLKINSMKKIYIQLSLLKLRNTVKGMIPEESYRGSYKEALILIKKSSFWNKRNLLKPDSDHLPVLPRFEKNLSIAPDARLSASLFKDRSTCTISNLSNLSISSFTFWYNGLRPGFFTRYTPLI